MLTRPRHLGTTLNSKGPHVTSEKNASAIEVLFRISLHSCVCIHVTTFLAT
jgi:hypothetical protein